MTEQEKNLLLKEAKQRFPIGTKYKCAQAPNSTRKCIIDETFYNIIRYNYGVKTSIDAVGYGFIYYNSKWAEVISKPESNLKVEDLVEDEVYVIDFIKHPLWQSIFKSKGKKYLKERLYTKQQKIDFDDGNWNEYYEKTFRLATPEEKQWLEAVIELNKFVEKEKALKYIQIKNELDSFIETFSV